MNNEAIVIQLLLQNSPIWVAFMLGFVPALVAGVKQRPKTRCGQVEFVDENGGGPVRRCGYGTGSKKADITAPCASAVLIRRTDDEFARSRRAVKL